jgi:hypothetical protein
MEPREVYCLSAKKPRMWYRLKYSCEVCVVLNSNLTSTHALGCFHILRHVAKDPLASPYEITVEGERRHDVASRSEEVALGGNFKQTRGK